MRNPEKILFGKRVTALRKTQGISRIDFSYKTGLNRDTLLKIEKGTSNVTLSTLVKISEGFGVTLSELLDGI
jgi:transcriptional regulator with XRE-family HTH domain